MITDVLLFKASGSGSHSDCAGPFAPRRSARRNFLKSAAAALLALSLGIGSAALADKDDDHGRQHWVATWATSPAAYFVYVAPLPQNQRWRPLPPGSPPPTSSLT